MEGESETIFARSVLDHKARYELLLGNHVELKAALNGFTPDLWKEERTRDYFQQKRLVVRRLFNWLAAAHALSDSTKRLMCDPHLTDGDRKQYEDALESGASVFIHELRHFSIHQLLPYVAGSRHSYGLNEEAKARALIELPRHVLIGMFQPRATRKPGAKKVLEYLNNSVPDSISLLSEVEAYERRVSAYILNLRARTELLSPLAREFLADDTNPEPLRMSEAARKRIENSDT